MKPTTKEAWMSERMQPEDAIGKYAWNESRQEGGIVQDVNERGVTIDGSYYNTITGENVFDSLCINGFKLYEPKNIAPLFEAAIHLENICLPYTFARKLNKKL